MEPYSFDQICGVCRKVADFLHFGAMSCRGCAAFFRRKVADKQIPIRRCSGKCELRNESLRRLCQSCRFDQCLNIGMKTSLVMSRTPIKTVQLETIPQSDSLLKQLENSYDKLLSARNIAFRLQENRKPEYCNYAKINAISVVDNNLVYEHIIPFFTSQKNMKSEYHQMLFPHFMVPFLIFECAYRSVECNVWILPNGDFIDVENLDKLYGVPNVTNEKIAKNASKLLKPYWVMVKNALHDLKEVKLELPEFLLLTALVYWDFGPQNQSDECIELCSQLRKQLIAELTNYEKTVRRNEDPCMRVGEVMMVLQSVQRMFSILQESREISMIYDLYEAHCPMYELMKI